MDTETLQVPFEWTEFELGSRLTNRGIDLTSKDECEDKCKSFVKNVTISTDYWQVEPVELQFWSFARYGTLTFPEKLGIRENVTVPFNITINE